MKAKAAKRAAQSEITAVYADRRGNICEAEGVSGMGRIGAQNVMLTAADLIPLPESADLMFMPEHSGVGQDAHGTEVRLAGILGADAVGMSTAVEAVAARHAGMRVCGISFISNLAAGISSTLLSEEEVLDAGKKAAPLFKQLVLNSIGRMGTV